MEKLELYCTNSVTYTTRLTIMVVLKGQQIKLMLNTIVLNLIENAFMEKTEPLMKFKTI